MLILYIYYFPFPSSYLVPNMHLCFISIADNNKGVPMNCNNDFCSSFHYFSSHTVPNYRQHVFLFCLFDHVSRSQGSVAHLLFSGHSLQECSEILFLLPFLSLFTVPTEGVPNIIIP